MPQPPRAQALPTGMSGQGSPGITVVLRWGAQAGGLAMCTPLCSSVPPAPHGQGQWVVGPPHATRRRCVLAPLWAAVTAQWLRDSTLASWTFSRASEGASRAGGGKQG